MKKRLLCYLLIVLAVSCPQNCDDCDQTGSQCYACSDKFELSVLGQCVANILIPNCDLYGPNNECFSCQPTFRLTNGQCQKDYSACLQRDPSDDTACDICGFGTVLQGKQCLGTINCGTNNTINCANCQTGFLLQGGNCVDNTGNCKTKANNGVCSQCATGYSLIGYQCIPSILTVYGCYIYDALGVCQACKDGFNPYQGSCLLPSQIDEINQGQTSVAQILAARKASLTVTTTTTTVTTTTANPDNSANTDFSGGGDFSFGDIGGFDFSGSSNNSTSTPNTTSFDGSSFTSAPASAPTTPQIPNCQVPDPVNIGNCITCVYGFYLTSYGCTAISQFCNGYNLQNGSCLSCKYSLTLSSGVCQDTNCLAFSSSGCSNCNTFYSANASGVCQYNDPNCATIAANKCGQCVSGYFVTIAGLCLQLPPNCAIANSQNSNCLQCNQGYQKGTSGACVLIPKPAVTQSPTQTSQQQSPTQTSQQQSQQSQKSQPSQQQSQQSSQNQQSQQGQNIQSPNIPNCQSYNLLTGICLSCISGYSLINAACVPSATTSVQTQPTATYTPSQTYTPPSYQPSGTVNIGTASVVSKRDPNCASYNGAICLNCSIRYYFTTAGVCAPVNPNCNTYSPNGGACTSCYQGFSLSGALCVTSKPADPYCKTTDNTGLCTACYSGYFYSLTKGSCQLINPLCKSSSLTDGSCTSCYPGYTLNNGLCSVSFQDPNCQTFDQVNKTLCVKCATHFYLGVDGKCKQVSSNCKTYNGNTGACTSCFGGYVLTGPSCLAGTAATIDINCQTSINGSCQACYKGFFINQQGVCTLVNPLCKTISQSSGACTSCYPGYSISGVNCTKANSQTNAQCKTLDPVSGGCASCYQGYNLVSNGCVIGVGSTSTGDPNCKSTDSTGICTSCYSGYYLNAGRGCSQMDPLCKTYTTSNNGCTSCYDGYALYSTSCYKATEVPNQNTDPYCITSQGPTCLNCSNGFYLGLNGTCNALNTLCKSSNLTNGQCTSCWSGYTLTNGNCVQTVIVSIPYCDSVVGTSCVDCIQGYYVSNGTCALVNILCATYDPTSGSCLSCTTGYVFQQGGCILPSLGIDPNCVIYAGSYCSQCASGYQLINYWCS